MEVAIPPANQPLQVEVVYEPDDDVVESYTVVVKEEEREESNVEAVEEPALKIIRPADVPNLFKDLASEAPECVDEAADLRELVTEMEFIPEELEAKMVEVCNGLDATVIEQGEESTISEVAAHLIARDVLDFNFYICDLGVVMRLYSAWRRALPRVRPFYAVKCMPDKGLLKTLCALGAGFDCATTHEIELAISVGADVNRIIFAHPQKMPREITKAAQLGANLTTFDTVGEVQKIANANKSARLVLRIRADDPNAKMIFGAKYGAERNTWHQVLTTAKTLGLQVVGVSFHVGSMSSGHGAYRNAISTARDAFDMATEIGHKMKLIDIGGGFQARFMDDGEIDMDFAAEIREALDEFFPPSMGVKFIAEPGRFFAEAPFTIVTNVFGKRVKTTNEGTTAIDYWISDGIYGSMNCKLYDKMEIKPRAIKDPVNDIIVSPSTGIMRHAEEMRVRKTYPSTLYGPTCDGADKVVEGMMLPEMNIGDWILFFKFGAYTLAGAVAFNGFMVDQDNMKVVYVFSKREKALPEEEAGANGNGHADAGQ